MPGLLRLINISSLPSSFYKPLVNVILFSSYFFIAFWTTAKKKYGSLGYTFGQSFYSIESALDLPPVTP